jgi:hypothetical protein
MSQLSSSNSRLAVDFGKDAAFSNDDSLGTGDVGDGDGDTSGDADGVSDETDGVSGDGTSTCPGEELDVQPARPNAIATAVTVTRHH